jgi:hypothetical protein
MGIANHGPNREVTLNLNLKRILNLNPILTLNLTE